MDWQLKALAFRMLDLPGGTRVHYFLQRHVTRSWPRRESTLRSLVEIGQRVVDDHRRHVGTVPESVLEIGAGRDLAVPLALRRLGVGRVVASDVDRLAKLDLVCHAARYVLAGQCNFKSWRDVERFGIYYRAPHCVTAADEKVDCSCSNEVLEHVPPDQLVSLLAALRAVTTGVTTHSIDHSDHYARSDPSVSRLNFLRYSDEEWRPFNRGRQYVNRLRHSDYLRLFRETGFRIVEEHASAGVVPPDLPANLAPQFRSYAPDDLFATKGRIVAVPD
jgi:hypothetical protein